MRGRGTLGLLETLPCGQDPHADDSGCSKFKDKQQKKPKRDFKWFGLFLLLFILFINSSQVTGMGIGTGFFCHCTPGYNKIGWDALTTSSKARTRSKSNTIKARSVRTIDITVLRELYSSSTHHFHYLLRYYSAAWRPEGGRCS